MRTILATCLLLAWPLCAQAQIRNRVNVNRLEHKLAGQLVDYTHNSGKDRRIYSPILGMPRDLYVYLPPCYDPRRAYPLVVYLHMAYVDEHTLPGSNRLVELDRLIQEGRVPPVIVASPDGTLHGENRIREPHSLFVNGVNGRFEDHLTQEVVPFLMRTYSIRPEREAHAALGASAGGLGAMNLALKHRDVFGAVATLAGPLNLRYWNSDGNYRENFDPATYRWNEHYDADMVIARFYLGLSRVRASKYAAPVFGEGPGVTDRIKQSNPADLLFATDLPPGALAMYVNYPGRDNYNFDAQDESFGWLAAQKGVTVELERVPCGRHNLPYFRSQHLPAWLWLGRHLLPPT
ncbi:MAG: alpha/beta hydrolase-fold protein [Isosphaeraceae bacterium]|nr:alpha/beta hydrolase-fold protein [Isosphaeraceae bacterium]